MVRIGDVGVIDVAPVEMPNGRLVSRALDNRIGCYVAAEAARLVAADGGAPGDVVALAVDPGGDDLRRLADERVRAGARRGDRRRRHLRHRPARDRAGPDDQAPARLGPGDRARARRCIPASPTCSSRPPRSTSTRSRSSRWAARPAPTPTPSTSAAPASPRARLGAAALHALARRAGLAGRHRGRRRADRRVRQAAGARHVVRAVAPWRTTAGGRTPCCSCSTSTGRCSAAPPTPTARRCTRRCTQVHGVDTPRAPRPTSRPPGAPTARSRGCCCCSAGVSALRHRRGRDDGARGVLRDLRPALPAQPRRQGPPRHRRASCVAGRARRRAAVAGHRQLRAGRAAEAGAGRARPPLPLRAGRLRLRRRGSRRAAGRSPASAPATTGSRIRAGGRS